MTLRSRLLVSALGYWLISLAAFAAGVASGGPSFFVEAHVWMAAGFIVLALREARA